MQRLAAIAVMLLGLMLAPGSATAATRPPAFDTRGGLLRIGLPLEPPNLDPTAGAAAAVDEVVYANIFQGLTTLAEDGSVRPGLADHWDASADGRAWTFHLRHGVRFHDGTPFDAAIAKFSLDRVTAPGSANAQKGLLAALAGVDVVDRWTVRLRLSRPLATLPFVLAWADMVMVTPRTAAGNAVAPVGTGPFRFVRWRRGDAIDLVRSPGYWGRPAKAARVRFRFFADPSAAYAALRSGDIDAFPNYPAPETVAQFASDPAYRVSIGRSQGKVILAINNARTPLNDRRVRRALSYAIDRAALIRGAMFGYGEPIGSHFARGDPAYVDLVGRYPRDPARARALLAAAGYPNGLDLVLHLPPRTYARRSGELIAQQLAAAGIRVRIETIEWAQWLDRVFKRHDFDLTIVEHVEPMDYGIYGRDEYYFGYRSAPMKALLARVDAAALPDERRAALGAVQRLIADDAVNVFLFQTPRIGVAAAGVHGLWRDAPLAATVLADAWRSDAVSATDDEPPGRWTAAAIPAAIGLLLLVAGGILFTLGPAIAARRLAVLAATLLAATLLEFFVLQVLPGDPAAYMMGLNATPDAIAALHRELGLAGSPPHRYAAWVLGLLRGDFGISYTYRTPVAGLIGERLAVSLPLAMMATLLSLLIAVPLGLIAALKRGSAIDHLVRGISQIGIALPNFWLAMLLVLLFSITIHALPAGGFPGWEAGFGPASAALALPTLALALPQAAILTRVLRAALVATMDEDYVRTARAKGLSRSQALRRHALRNATIPLLSVLGLQIPFLLGGTIVVENVFALPGLGRLIFQSITQRDLIVVQGVVIVLVFAAVFTAFLIDVAYLVIDPRLRVRR